MESYGLYNFNFSFEIWLCTVVLNCVIRLYLFLSDTRTHIIKISFINLSKKFAKEKISTMFDSFLFSIRYLYGCIEKKKKKKKNEKKKIEGSSERVEYDVHFCGTEILVFSWRQKMNFTMWSWSVDTKQSAVWFLAYRICWLSTENNSIPVGWTVTTRILSIWNTCFSHTFGTRIKSSRLSHDFWIE